MQDNMTVPLLWITDPPLPKAGSSVTVYYNRLAANLNFLNIPDDQVDDPPTWELYLDPCVKSIHPTLGIGPGQVSSVTDIKCCSKHRINAVGCGSSCAVMQSLTFNWGVNGWDAATKVPMKRCEERPKAVGLKVRLVVHICWCMWVHAAVGGGLQDTLSCC
jgi:hypothetical protein